MEPTLHRVVGLYPSMDPARRARDELAGRGVPPSQMRVLSAGAADASAATGEEATVDSDEVLKDLLRDGAIGTAVGTAADAGVTISLAAAHLTLFIANPALGALSLLGWGASLGGGVGAVVSSERSKGDVSSLI